MLTQSLSFFCSTQRARGNEDEALQFQPVEARAERSTVKPEQALVKSEQALVKPGPLAPVSEESAPPSDAPLHAHTAPLQKELERARAAALEKKPALPDSFDSSSGRAVDLSRPRAIETVVAGER